MYNCRLVPPRHALAAVTPPAVPRGASRARHSPLTPCRACQTIGMQILARKEEEGRALLASKRISTDDIQNGDWGKVRTRLKENGLLPSKAEK